MARGQAGALEIIKSGYCNGERGKPGLLALRWGVRGRKGFQQRRRENPQ